MDYLSNWCYHVSRAAFVENNCKETYCEQNNSIMGIDIWILMDNGGEFAKNEMQELGNQYRINIKQTAAYSPRANELN